MRRVFIILFVLVLASPAFGRELTTRNKTSVYEKADRKSKVLAELEPDAPAVQALLLQLGH